MIDIIIPVYNTPDLDLLRCLDSVKNQTYKEYKAIIIDDGSNKATAKLLDDYCNSNPNFIVKHILNGGQSNARNIGLVISNNEYLTFLDSDDTLEPTFLEEALKILVDNDLDMVVGGYNEIKDNKIKRIRKSEEGLHIYEGEDIDKYFDKLLSGKLCEDNKEIASTPTGRIYTKLYKRSIIKDTIFDINIKISEDTLFEIDLMRNVNRIGVVPNIWYNYYQNDYSIVHKKLGQQELENLYDFMNEIYIRMIVENNHRIKNAYKMRIFKTCADLEDTINNIDNTFLDREIFKQVFKTIDITSYIDMKEKELTFYNKYDTI
jgi:glycosyltransferase involved in cell wall biosynthesis